MASKALEPGTAKATKFGWRPRRLLVQVLALAVFFGLASGLQSLAGAYHAELSGYPDEPGHLVTGVLAENYVTTLPLQPPVAFATEFYIHRPKIAIGHWPPVLYLLRGHLVHCLPCNA